MADAAQSASDRGIGAAIRAARVAEGLTQGELATLLGIDRSTVAKYERGQRAPSVNVLLQIAQTLHIPLAALVPHAGCGAASAAVWRTVQLLARRPDLAPAALAALDAALDQERHAATSADDA